MAFEKGNKLGKGRPKGALNQLNADSKTKLHEIYEEDLLSTFREDLKELKPNERIQVFLKLTEFFVPKLRATYMETDIAGLSDIQFGAIMSATLNQFADNEERRLASLPKGTEENKPGGNG